MKEFWSIPGHDRGDVDMRLIFIDSSVYIGVVRIGIVGAFVGFLVIFEPPPNVLPTVGQIRYEGRRCAVAPEGYDQSNGRVQAQMNKSDDANQIESGENHLQCNWHQAD